MKTEWLSTNAAARKMGVSLRWVQALCDRGRIPSRRCECGRDWLVDAGAVENWRPNPVGRPKRSEA